ncbi:hypothetical protein [Robertkochia aurantiaca]|uniref:hypothetical protein n=1 Tax=Robertkochia aurantiaca TaxID=2873700 RepID=UPI001CCD6368|nr:hypothetical protein [Robertkochia sp. 3YJGBD-33]
MKGKRFLMLPVLLLLGANVVKGQQHGIETEDKKLSDIFGKAHFHGHIRNYFMSTLNEGELTDYYTNATGGAIAIRTSNWKGFEAGVKGIFTYRTFSSDLNRADPTVGEMARWEFELYDITDPHNFNDLDRLEELYIT